MVITEFHWELQEFCSLKAHTEAKGDRWFLCIRNSIYNDEKSAHPSLGQTVMIDSWFDQRS